MKKKYESPTCFKVTLMPDTGVMLVLSVFSDEETEIVGARGSEIFDSDDFQTNSDYNSYDYLWEDEEDF
jgi:hypothetical protein